MTAIDSYLAEGALVRIRHKRLSDAEDDFAWRRDPELARFDAALPIRNSYREFLSTFEDELRFPNAFRRTLAVDDEEGRHIGNVMYYNIDEHRHEAELGITIGVKSCWNRGYGTDILVTFLHYLFIERQMRRIYLNTLDWNTRAQRAFQKAGFRTSGTNRRGLHSFVTMEALREWFIEEE